MQDLKSELVELFGRAIVKVVANELDSSECRADVTLATSAEFGHYQCNSSLRLSKHLRMPPRKVAEAIVEALEDKARFEKVEIAGPGFINITLSSAYLSEAVSLMLSSTHLGAVLPKKQHIVIDFSSPNIAKEMHVGHLRSTIIGDALARLFEFFGHEVIRLNHIGDWGTSFGMLIAHLLEMHPEVISGQKSCELEDLMAWYRASKKRFDEEEDFKKRALQAVVKLQAGETEMLQAWKQIVAISKKAFKKIYEQLSVKIEDRGESFYNPFLAPLIEDLEKRNVVTVSDGAKCIFIEGIEIPLMVQKSDGGYNYDTTDLAAMRYRIEKDGADRIIVVTDAGQSLHFKLVYEAAKKAGYLDDKKVRFDHVTFGVVLGSDGKRFRTRSGEVARLADLIEAAIVQAKALLLEREHDLSIEASEELAHILGINAIKYADLSCNRVRDYLFSYERMLRFEGNTATFLLYSYVRIHGIKRKMGVEDIEPYIRDHVIELSHASEKLLGFHLMQFGQVLQAMAQDLYPHYLTDYLYELAQKFNSFFRDCRVEGAKEEASRLLLAELTARVLRQGLEILGLKVVSRM